MNTPITFHPVTKDRLADLSHFSEAHGRFRYCSCMRWRLRSAEFSKSTKDERIDKLDELVCSGIPVGILAYANDIPVGWCSVAPRESFAGLQASRVLPPIDDLPVWSVTCFFVDQKFRRQNLSVALLKAAVRYALEQGAPTVEGYPIAADSTSYTFMGRLSTFLKAGFQDVTPDGQKRTIMRYAAPHRDAT